MPLYIYECEDCKETSVIRISYQYYPMDNKQCRFCGSENLKRLFTEPTPFILKGKGWTLKKKKDNDNGS